MNDAAKSKVPLRTFTLHQVEIKLYGHLNVLIHKVNRTLRLEEISHQMRENYAFLFPYIFVKKCLKFGYDFQSNTFLTGKDC